VSLGAGASKNGPDVQKAKLVSNEHLYELTADMDGTASYADDAADNGLLVVDNVGGPFKLYWVGVSKSGASMPAAKTFYTRVVLKVTKREQ
jgi:hypothetical protein